VLVRAEDAVNGPEAGKRRWRSGYALSDFSRMRHWKRANIRPPPQALAVTVHSARPEFDAVFISGLEEGLFPHDNSLNTADGVSGG
jgi:superfamily I DNA/RNA helicase